MTLAAHPGTPHPSDARGRRIPRVPLVIVSGVVALLLLAGAFAWRAHARTNKVALAASPKPVTVVAAKAQPFRVVRLYVGELRPWIEAHVGPQFISAYVKTVLVRPGAVVKENEVLATLDCRYANEETAALSAQAKAIARRQRAIADQAARTRSMLDGGFVSENETELVTASSESQAAELEAQKANLSRSVLDVNDCILRAPFDGEISVRLVDPGSFVRPGTEMLAVVDRNTVRMTADAPEADFDAIEPGASVTVHVLAINIDIPAAITRRAPSADPGTRTVHFEIDIANSSRRIPVDTTGEVRVPVGNPAPATAVPLKAVRIDDDKATFFTVEGGVAHTRVVIEMGEVGPDVFFPPEALVAGTEVVLEGQALLNEGDQVIAKSAPIPPPGGAGSIKGPRGSP
ncbi:MAG TPA: efflux RND transporter periplasmic adaptor subunit [Polyangiaceae bacterium]|jgi:RND family efflux transporter MFP subunit